MLMFKVEWGQITINTTGTYTSFPTGYQNGITVTGGIVVNFDNINVTMNST
jgi:hypothetical protein